MRARIPVPKTAWRSFALQQVWAQVVLAADLGLALDSTENIKDQATLELESKMAA